MKSSFFIDFLSSQEQFFFPGEFDIPIKLNGSSQEKQQQQGKLVSLGESQFIPQAKRDHFTVKQSLLMSEKKIKPAKIKILHIEHKSIPLVKVITCSGHGGPFTHF